MKHVLFDVFISYSHEDIEWAKWLHDGLSKAGLKVFLDQTEIRFGDNVPARIEDGLEHSISVLVLLSQRSLSSSWVRFESSFDWDSVFLRQERGLVPVVIEKGCEIPARLRGLRACVLVDKDEATLAHLLRDLLARDRLEIGPYQIARDEDFPEDLAENIISCIARYVPDASPRLQLTATTITELLDNAFRHTNSSRATLKASVNRRYVEITVCDTGGGFALANTLTEIGRQLDLEPHLIGRRGLTLLESQGVVLGNGGNGVDRHSITGTIWWKGLDNILAKVRKGECTLVPLSGRLTLRVAGEIEAVLASLLRHTKSIGIVLDMSAAEYIDSVGLRVLLVFAKEARERNVPVAAVGLRPVVLEIFRISRFDNVIPILSSCDDAEALLRRLRSGFAGNE